MDSGGDGAVQRARVEACDAGAEDFAGGDGGDCWTGDLCGDAVEWAQLSEMRGAGVESNETATEVCSVAVLLAGDID